MSETMLAALTNIRTAEDMIVAFRDEEQCRRLLESMVCPGGRVLPCLWLQALDRNRRARYGQATCASGSLSMLQRRLSLSVYGDDTHAAAFHKASSECLAEGHVAYAAVG